MGDSLRKNAVVPRIFQVNWFRKGSDGRFLWPGFAENSRVLAWILDRVDAQVPAKDSPLGLVPTPGGIERSGLDVTDEDWDELFAIDHDAWLNELEGTEKFFGTFGNRLPAALPRQLADIRKRLEE
jgi:phosphoenolpyruvate carboxykinase (GTP)